MREKQAARGLGTTALLKEIIKLGNKQSCSIASKYSSKRAEVRKQTNKLKKHKETNQLNVEAHDKT